MTDGRCEELREDLSAYVDDELGADARARVEEHLRACEECRGELERLRKLVRLVSSVPREEPPAGLREKISARVREEPRPRRLVPRMPWWLMSSAVAAALVGVVALAAVLRVVPARTAAERKPAAAPRPSEAAEDARRMVARDAEEPPAFEAKRKALPPAPRPAAPRALPEKKRGTVARAPRRLQRAREGLKEEKARAVSGLTRTPAPPEPSRPALGLPFAPSPEESERARDVAEAELAKVDESTAMKSAARAPAFAMGKAKEEDKGSAAGRFLELAAGSFEEAVKLVRLAARDAGGRLERADDAAGELVCLIPEGRVSGFAAALSPPGGKARRAPEAEEAPVPGARGRERRVSAVEYEKGAEEAQKLRLVRVVVRVRIRRP